MKKNILFTLFIIIIILNRDSIYFLICFQDFSIIADKIQILSSSYFSIPVAFLLNILLRSICNLSLCYIVRKIIPPIPYNSSILIYSIIFILYFIPIPLKGYILIILSLFPISLFYTFILMNFASLPAMICHIIGHKTFGFNDYKFSLFIGIIYLIGFMFYIFSKEKKNLNQNL